MPIMSKDEFNRRYHGKGKTPTVTPEKVKKTMGSVDPVKLTEAYRAGVQRAIESQEGYGEVQGAIRHLARVSRGGTAPITGSVSRREDLTDDEREALKVKQAEEDERFRLEHPERVSDELADTDTGRILTRLLALDEDEATDMLGAISGTAEKALLGKSGYIANPMLNFATGIMDTANMVPEVRNIAQDIKTEGAYTREASVISDFMSRNPVYREKYLRGEITKERLLSLINRNGADVSRENLNWWLAANSSAMRDALVYERTDGVADGYKKIVGGGAKSIGRMVIPLMAGNAIGAIGNAVSGSSAVAGSASAAGSSGGLIGSIIARKSLGEILRNALAPSVSKVIMSIGAGTSAFNENANAGAGVGANAAYSTLSSFSEYLAEGLFGLPSAEAFGSSGNTIVRNIIGSLTDGKVTGNTVKVLLQNLAQYAVNAGEEGLEEGVTNILNGLVSKITVSPDKQWFGEGGVFDFRQIGMDVASGAFVGAVMGSVGVITSSVAQCLESGDIRGAAEVLNTWAADHLDERYRPADLDPKTATAETVKAHHEMILEAYARQIEDADRAEAEAEVSEHLTELVEKPADEHIVEETEVPSEKISAEDHTEVVTVPTEEIVEAPDTPAEDATEEVRADEATTTETAAEESHGAEEGISAVTSSAEAEVVGPGGMTLGQVIPRFRAMGEAGFSLIKTINEAIRSGIIFAGVSKETMHRLIVAHAEGLAAREVKKSNVQDPREDARNSSEKPEKETVTTAEGANGDAFTITDNAQYGTLEIKFDGKPSEAVRNVLKAHKFRWHGKRKIWYGKADRSEVEEALREAYLQDKAQTSQSTVQNAENPVDSTEKGREDTGKSQIGDTMEVEIAEPSVVTKESEAEDRSANANADAPSMQVASYFLDRFRAGVYPNKKVLEEKCAKAFGGTLAEGAYTPKDAYDALELAVNLYLKELARDFNTDDPAGAVQALAKLEELVGNLPTQTNRTAEQEKFQQFSTPPTIAYLAAWAANVKASDVVLEPSAGIGGLAVYPKAWGATVAVNELDERRRGVLSHMGFDLMTGEDARYVQDVPALAGVSPSVVLMNPPFSSQATTGMAANTATSFEHVEAALEKLTDEGRLVTVLGAGRDGVDSKQFTAWIRKLKKDYTVRANVVIDGKNYRKYGTDFNVRIVVIDKVGAHTGETVTGTFTNLKELPEKLKGVRDARQQSGRAGLESDRGLAGDTGGVRADPRVSGAERAVGAPHAGAGVPVGGGSAGVHDGTHGGGGGSASRSAVQSADDLPAERGRAAGERDVGQPRSQQTGRSGESDSDRVRAGAGSPASGHEGSGGGDAGQLRGVDQRRGDARAENVTAPAPESDPAPAKDYKAGTPKKKPKDTGVYSDYVAPALPVKGLKAHPAVLVESSAMASVQAPKATYKPHLPQDAINRGVWSGEQMVNIVYAGQAHEQTLPNGTRKGYLIGDGTGVGKGRQIAGIIMDNLAQGRKRAVWVSNNSPLYEDAIRDWTAVGGDKADVMLYERSKADKRAGSDGILFTTYSTLGAKPTKSSKDKATNLDKIVAWLGEDFDGVIAFDEAHNMANAIPKKGGWGQQKPAAKALAGLELQRRLPKARVVYVSATAATSVGELAYAERLGLWGEGTSFRDRETFLDKLMQAGTAGMELVARDMKAMGVYNARSISYDGVQYDTLRHKLTRQQKDMYDKMSDAWQIVMQNVENAMVVTGAVKDGKARGRYLSGLYGSLQRFYQQILCALSMPSVIEDIQRELDAGHSCVLQIVNTNEAQENRTKAAAKETDAELEELDFSPRNILIDYLTNAFPITRYEEYMDEDGNKRSREVKDADGNPVISQKAVAMRDDLISQIQALSIPDNPLDMLYRAFGVDNVAEITGRSSRVVPLPDEHGEMHLVDQKRGKAANSADVEAFQNGDKRILVFSDAGGTGKSYHADRAAGNQQKRIHYLIQPGWNATKAVQGFGRTHRSNQVSAPTYKLVTTDISGQARFISTIAKRLDNLGAMTKGQRQAGSGFFSAADNLESDLAAQTLFTFYRMLDRGAYPEFSGRSIIRKLGLERKLYTQEGTLNIEASDMMDVSLFLNRVLSLRFDEQNALFGHFVDLLTQFTEEAEQRGELDRGMENVRADRAELVDEKIIRDYENGGEPTKFLRIKTYTKARIEPSVKRIQKTANDFLGIYRDTKGQARAIFALADKTEMNGAVTKRYRVQSPNVGRHGVIDGATLRKYTRVSTDDMEAAWDEAVAAMPEYDVRDTYMVTGALLPIWDRLSDANIKVQRITLDSGERYLGRVINQTQADQLLRQFGQSRKAEKLTGEQIVNTVIGEGRVVTVEKMYSGYELERARVSGENRIEIVGKRRQQAMYDMAGVIEEKIGSEYRYFIPVGEKGAAMLDKLIRDGARVSVKEESGTEGLRARKKPFAKQTDQGQEQEQSRTYLDGDQHFDNELSRDRFVIGTDYDLRVRKYSMQEISDLFHRGRIDPEHDELFERLCEFCENAGIMFKVVPNIYRKDGSHAPGVTRGNTVKFSQSQLNRTDVSNERKSKTILHEMLHAATTYAITAYDIAVNEGVIKDLSNNIVNSCKTFIQVYEAIRRDANFTGQYGLENVKEMVAELSNPLFVEKLKNAYPSNWHRLLDSICRLLGINKDLSYYGKLKNAVDSILSDPDYELAQDYYEVLSAKNPYYLNESEYFDKTIQEQQRIHTLTDRDESEWTPTEIPDGERNVERSDVEPVSLSELTSLIQERFGVHITFGHLRTRNTDGEYDNKTGGMRVKLAGDLPGIAHELGHHLEREFGLGDFEERNRTALEAVLTPEMRDAYKEELRASEGFAELLRYYIIDRDGAELKFGRDADGKPSDTSLFYQFEAAMDEKTLADLQEVSDLVYALLNDTSVSSAKAVRRQRSHVETFFNFTSSAARALRDKEYRGELMTDTKENIRASITEQTRIFREGVTAQEIGKSWYARFMTRWVDRNYLLYEVARAGDGNAEAYVYAQNAAYAGGVAFANAVDTELCDIDGKVVGESLGAILKPLYTEERKGMRFFSKMDYAKYDAFNEYLVIRHAPERMAEGMKIFGDPRLDTPEYCEVRQAELEAEYPEFADMAMRLYEFQTSMLKTWAVQTGIVSASMADEWGKRWNNYVPLQRVMDDKIRTGGRAAKKSYANQKSPWHRAVGSTRDIVAPVDSIVTTLTNLVSISHRNRVMLSLTEALKAMPDSSFLMEKIPAHVKRESVDTTAAKDSMLEDMMENGMDSDLSMAVMELVNKYFDDTMERFTRKAKPGEPDEITVLRNGKAELWQVNNRELFEVVAGLQGDTRNGILKLCEKLTRFQVGALTGNNLAWSLRSNIFRDIQAAGTYLMGDIDYLSRDGIKTVHKEVARRWVSLIKGYGKSFVSSFRDTYGHGSQDVYWKEMMALGGSDSALWASDKRASLRVQKEIEKSVSTKLSPFRFVSCVSEAIEKGPRYAAYKLYRESGAEPSYAFYRAMDLTVNFKRGGTVSKDLTKVIPFFNASVQGIDRMVRYYTGQQIDRNMQVVHGEARKQLIKQRAVLTLVSAVIGVALAQILRQMDKEDYDRLSTYTKNNFWCIPLPGSHKFITIPKPRELTVLQSGLERGLDYILGDEHAYDEFGEYAIGTLAPPIVSDVLQIPSDGLEDATFGALSSIGIIGPAVEIYANKNFLGQPIIPSYLEDVLPEDQYKQSTSLLAFWLGNTALGRGLGLSPVGIDHFGESVLGGYWELHKSLLPLNGDYRDMTVGFGSSIVRNSAYSTDVANRLYDGREAAMLAYNSDPEDPDKKITYKWYDTAASFYSRYGKLAKATEDGKQAEDDRLRALEHVESFLSVMESGGKVAGQDELEAYVRATGDTSVMPGVMQTFIKYGENGAFDRELSLDAEEYIEFQGKYNDLFWKYATKALAGNLTEEQRGEALQVARDQALIEAKNYILGLHGYSSKRYRQTTGYDDVKSAGVSLTDYAKVKQFWREAESDKDRNGQTVSGSKRDKVAEYIDSLRISDRKKDALYLAMGYSESTLKDAPWH